MIAMDITYLREKTTRVPGRVVLVLRASKLTPPMKRLAPASGGARSRMCAEPHTPTQTARHRRRATETSRAEMFPT